MNYLVSLRRENVNTLILDNEALRTRIRNENIVLRRIPPQIRVTSGQKLCTEIIYIVLQTSVRLF